MSEKNSVIRDDTQKKVSPHIWFRMLKYFSPCLSLLIVSMALALLVNFADLLSPYLTKIVIDNYIESSDQSFNIRLLGAVFILTVIVGAVSQYFQSYFLNSMGQKIMHNIRMEVFTHIQHMPFKFFDMRSGGTILTRATNDIEALNELYSGVIVALFKDFFMIIGIVIVMVRINPRLALVSFSILPLIIFATVIYNKKAKANFRWVRRLIGTINGFFAENISGMKVVQIFNREKEKYQEFKKLNDEYNKASVFGVFLNAAFKPLSEFINSIAITLIIWFCAGDILNGVLQIGVLYAFINYSRKFFNPINDLADKYATIQSGSVSAERIFELLDEKKDLEDLKTGIDASKIRGKIEFKNVWFAYVESEWVLKDISFCIEPGETAAFVGATGSGKSTIINLMGRYYDIQKGEILIDGVDIKKYSRSSLRKSIAVVQQDVFLFAGDIKSNIRLCNEDISDEDIVRAAKYVNADGFISKLKKAYNEEVVERGATLSSGQRQLLSLARAIAFNPKIMVLDEATANIDTENELLIQDSMEKLSKDRTTVVIAHRLSTIKNSDKIIVLHNGVIRETGTHDELLVLNGIYKKLYELIAD